MLNFWALFLMTITPVQTQVTAYNLVPEQTDSSPCISADGSDVCELLDYGYSVCAANSYPLGSIIYIEDYGSCIVRDRTHSRYGHRVDIAMKATEIDKALQWGIRYKKVYLVK